MRVNLNNETSFNGKFSSNTLTKFRQNLSPQDFKQVEKFRTSKRYTNIDIVTINREPYRLSSGIVVTPKETFVEFSNSRAKNGIKARIIRQLLNC